MDSWSESPSFPSLYNPRMLNVSKQFQLEKPSDVYRFTLYWSLILFIPLFVVPGIWALAMIALALFRRERPRRAVLAHSPRTLSAHLTSRTAGKIRATVIRTRALSLAAVALPALFALTGAILAVVLSVCVAYLLVGAYSVAGFTISTYIPFVWSLMQVMFCILGSYSLVIDII